MADDCLESPITNEYSLRKRLKMPLIMKALSINKTDKVLDIGCGSGIFSEAIAKQAKEAYGLDYSKTNILNVRSNYKNLKNLHFVIGDASNMPFKDNYFDAVLATELIEHIQNDNKFLQECNRVLKKGGKLIITTPCTNPLVSVDWFRKIGAGIDMSKDFGHKRPGYTKEELYSLLKKNKFKIENYEYYDQFFAEIAWVITCMPRSMTNKNWKSGEGQDKISNTKLFKFYKFIFPLVLLFAQIDVLFKKFRGHHILVKAIKI
ncbi:MAG: methyltransferase domain-containing protein [archaeon]